MRRYAPFRGRHSVNYMPLATLSMEEDISSDDSSEETEMTKDVSPAGASRSGITANGNAPSSKDYDSDSFTEVTRKKTHCLHRYRCRKKCNRAVRTARETCRRTT
ncbi:hypothetical protein TNCV_790341 [Trichonephila clavipes]|nr:hypothetical protein TNCV_790341 [Trichonephila clavipes]